MEKEINNILPKKTKFFKILLISPFAIIVIAILSLLLLCICPFALTGYIGHLLITEISDFIHNGRKYRLAKLELKSGRKFKTTKENE